MISTYKIKSPLYFSTLKEVKFKLLIILLLCLFENNIFGQKSYNGNPLISGSILDINYHFSSNLPLAIQPSFGIRLPFPLTTKVNISNSKFIVNDPLSVFFLKGDYSSWIGSMLNSSFDLDNLSPKEISDKLSKELNGGVEINLGITADYCKIGKSYYKNNKNSGFLFGINSNSFGVLNIPGDAFALIFSYNDGLQKGNIIDFRSLYGEFQFSTDLLFGYGRELSPVLNIRGNQFKLFWAISAAYKLGHYMIETKMEDGYIVYDENNVLKIHSDLNINSVGLKFDENMNIKFSSDISNIINGQGIGFSADFSMAGKKLLLSLGLNDFGFMFWNSNIQNTRVSFSKDSATIIGLLEDNDTVSAEFLELNNIKQILKGSINLKASFYSSKKTKSGKVNLNKVSNARALTFNYLQPIVGGFIQDYNPEFSMIFENEFFDGIMPVKIGWSLNTSGQYGSLIQIRQVVTRGISFTLSYCANNDPIFRWGKGGEISLSSNIYFD